MKHFYFKATMIKTIINPKRHLFILMFILLLLSQSVYPQCKLVKSTDDFSSSQSVHSNDVTLASVFPLLGTKKPWDITMQFMMIDTTCSILITHASQSYSTDFKSIYFKFTDGSVIKKESPNGSSDYDNGFGYQYTGTLFVISKEELITFSKIDIAKIEATFSYFPDYPIVEQDLKEKNSKKLKKDASCMLEEFNSFNKIKKEVNSTLLK